tara:strand:+ start:141 stop:539 length:399 start_codon:yes stop_codon:yes gene_type:complete
MTEDTSPENLRKFLESDDPAMVRMGLSMAKGSGMPEEMLGLVAGLYMWHDDKTVRAAAKSTFMKQAPRELQLILSIWKPEYRKIKKWSTLKPKIETIVESINGTKLHSLDFWNAMPLQYWTLSLIQKTKNLN